MNNADFTCGNPRCSSWYCAKHNKSEPFTINEIEKTITLMRQRHSDDQGLLSDSMCRLSLAASEYILGEAKKYRQILEDIAENECVYNDNCPDFVKLNHYECIYCKARKALENVQ